MHTWIKPRILHALYQNTMGFFTLSSPHAMSSSTIAKQLNESIRLVGSGDKGYSAKSFGPTVVMCAVNMGYDPNVARAIGRWKCQQVFEQHYVHTKVPSDYLDKLFD